MPRKGSNDSTASVTLQTFYTEMMQMEQRRNAQSEQLEQRLSAKIDTLAAMVGALPRASEVADLKESLRGHQEQIDKLRDSDKRWGGIAAVVSAVIAGLIGWLTK